MKLATWVLVGLVFVLLMSIGCSSSNDVINPPVADGACSNPTGQTDRFVDCGNGTVTDTQTGLLWLKDANCSVVSPQTWAAATDPAGTVAHLKDGDCELTDHSSAGNWRLPTKEEWEAIVKASCYPSPGGPTIPDKVGTGCYATGTQWASGVQSNHYWSSATYTDDPSFAWDAHLHNGVVNHFDKTGTVYVWPVRGGA